MTATRDIARGDLIFSEKPLNRGPKMSGKPVCLGCYRVLKGGEVLCPKGMEEHHSFHISLRLDFKDADGLSARSRALP